MDETQAAAPLTYECPHCHARVGVADGRLGEPVDCGQCGRPFRAAMPVGRLVGEDGSRADGSGRGPESELMTVHPAVFRAHPLRSLLFALLGMAGVTSLFFGVTGRAVFEAEPTPLIIAGCGMLFGSTLYFGYCALLSRATVLTITDRRTTLTKGILSKSTNEVDHDDLRNVKCDQSLIERTLGYGDIALSSSGQDEMEIVIQDIPNPQQVLDVIRRYR